MREWGWRLISKIGALLLLASFLLLISLPNLIDLENFRPQLLTYLQSQLSGELTLGKLQLTFAHGPGIRLESLRLLDHTGAQEIAVATAVVNFNLRHLLQRRLQPSRITLVRPRFVLQVDSATSPWAAFLPPVSTPSISTAVEQPEKVTEQPNRSDTDAAAGEGVNTVFGKWYFAGTVSRAALQIIDGSVAFTDCCFGSSPVVTRLEELNLFLQWHKSGAPAGFTLAFRVLDDQGAGHLQLKGTLSSLQWPLHPGEMLLDCQVAAANLNAATYFPYYQKYVPMRFIGARVDIDSTYQGNLLGLFRSRGKIVLHQAELDYQQVFSRKLNFNRFAVDYDFRLADRYNTIETLKCAIDADGLKLSGHCLLHDARRGIDGTIEAGLEIPEFDPASISALLPWKILPEKIFTYYRLLQPGGRCAVERAYLKGDYRKIVRLAEKNPPSGVVGGQLKVDGLHFNLADEWPAVTVSKAGVMFEGDSLVIDDLAFAWAGIAGEPVKLSIQQLFHDPQFALSGRYDFDLKSMQPLIERFYQTGLNKPGKSFPLIFGSGFLHGDLACTGAFTRLFESSWGGMLAGRNLSFVVEGKPYPVNRGAASLILAQDRLVIEKGSCLMAALPLTFSGNLPGPATWLSPDRGSDLAFELTVKMPQVVPGYLDLLWRDKKLSVTGECLGPSPLAMHVSGDLNHLSDFQCRGTVALDWGAVKLSALEGTFDRLSCLAEFDRDKIAFKRLSVGRGGSDLSFQGALAQEKDGAAYVVRGELSADRLVAADFLPAKKIFAEANGAQAGSETAAAALPAREVDGSGFVGRGGPSAAFPLPAVRVDLKGVVKELQLPALSMSAPPEGYEAEPWQSLNNFTFSLVGGPSAAVTINACHWQWGKQRAEISVLGEVQYRDKGWAGTLEVGAEDLDLDTLLNWKEPVPPAAAEQALAPAESGIRAWLLAELAAAVEPDAVENLVDRQGLLARNNLRIKARAQHLLWQRMTLDELEGDCTVNASGVRISNLAGRSFGGNFKALAQWSFSDDSFALESRLDNIYFETLNDYLENPARGLPMQGGYGSAEFNLGWQGRSLKRWQESLGGRFAFDFYDGRLKKFTLLANVCSLLNLSQFAALKLPMISIDQGVPYQTLTGKGVIDQGVVRFDDFAMCGTSLNLFCEGKISLPDEQVDLKIGVQPLQTIDKLLATIPVVGYIITGEKKTFVVIPITATGSFDDIKLKSHTVAGLGNKAVGMLQRFFKTPVRLLQMPGKLLNQIESEGDAKTAVGGERQ
ncbi:MAG: AsmA-like C-terminal domain-containing protein [Deltaproteobacteria bacterium]|nr:AsmA-like C-terminal domain-containing protein [Deltaproteobacteria bacterium]